MSSRPERKRVVVKMALALVVVAVLAAGCSSSSGAADVVVDIADSVVTVTRTEIQAIVDENGDFVAGGEAPAGTGSGVVIDDDGHVLTNAHVIAGAVSVFVVGVDGIEREAEVIAVATEQNDLAILKLADATGLAPIAIGSALDMSVGESVIAVGNPLGLGLTVTSGILSAVDRNIRTEFGELYG
ncbi:MAG: S1C family serine protease, partial [Acidimicrobiia bacterium]